MDLGFNRLDALRADAVPAPLDYLRLIASLAAMQAASRTAATEARLASGTFIGTGPVVALVELFDAGGAWTLAVTSLGGSFEPRLAAQKGRLTAPTEVTGPFTLRR